MKERRMRAADMFRRGKSQADVARELGVSRKAAWNWYWAWSKGGSKALSGAGRAGRRPRLSDDQFAEVLQALLKGPKANGFETELWTLARVSQVIEKISGVRYSESGTWKILRERLDWSRRAIALAGQSSAWSSDPQRLRHRGARSSPG
jgi:transposase